MNLENDPRISMIKSRIGQIKDMANMMRSAGNPQSLIQIILDKSGFQTVAYTTIIGGA